ncbi:MAG: BatA and WFA domain-containing protein [candidate division Zixibacteria bacterium]|nr:BatA and WFA domain-containing protein [candidate division Zixibacteria bacterium]
MAFANPWALFLLAAVVPLVLLYLFREDEKPLTVPSLLFWDALDAHPETPRSFRHRRLLTTPLFYLQMFILLLVTATAAEPVWQGSARRLVLVVDVSAGMKTREIGGTRFDIAKRQTRALLDGLDPGDEVAIIAAGATPEPITLFTGDMDRLYRTLDALDAQDTPGRLSAALTLAASIGDTVGMRDVVVLTDHPVEIPPTGPDAATRYHVIYIGQTDVNTGFVGLDVEPALDDKGVSARLTLRNAGTTPGSGAVYAVQDGREIFRSPISIAPGGSRQILVPGIVGKTPATVMLDITDSLSADNHVYVVPSAGSHPRLYAATNHPDIARLIRSLDGFESVIGPEGQVPPQDAGYSVQVYDGFWPDPMPSGGVVILDPPVMERFTTEEPVYDWEERHPVLRGIVMERLSLAGAGKMETPPVYLQTLARTLTHPVVLAGEQNGFRHVVLALDIARQMENPAALLLFLKTIAYVDPAAVATWVHLKTGEPLVIHTPGDTAVALVHPSGVSERLAVRNGFAQSDDLRETGLYTLRRSGTERLFPANLLDTEETDILPVTALSSLSSDSDPPDLRPVSSVEAAIWRQTLQIGLILLCAAWGLEVLGKRE